MAARKPTVAGWNVRTPEYGCVTLCPVEGGVAKEVLSIDETLSLSDFLLQGALVVLDKHPETASEPLREFEPAHPGIAGWSVQVRNCKCGKCGTPYGAALIKHSFAEEDMTPREAIWLANFLAQAAQVALQYKEEAARA